MSLTPQTSPLVLAFGHTARSGKGECVQTIYRAHSREHGGQYNIAIFSFAKALRDEIHQAMFDQWNQDHPRDPCNYRCSAPSPAMLMEHLCNWAGVSYDPLAKVDELNPFGKQRALQQYWGVWRREQNPFYWLRKVDEAIERRAPQVALIDDLRFENEYWWVDYLGGCKIKVERPGYEGLTPEQQAHPSEHALDGFEFDHEIIVPNGHLEQLHAESLETFDKVLRKHNACEFVELADEINAQPFIAASSL